VGRECPDHGGFSGRAQWILRRLPEKDAPGCAGLLSVFELFAEGAFRMDLVAMLYDCERMRDFAELKTFVDKSSAPGARCRSR